MTVKTTTEKFSLTLKNQWVFFKQFISNFQYTGATCPILKWGAEAMAFPIDQATSQAPKTILEAGPGTGAVTKAILKRLKEKDILVISEINPHFMEQLKENLKLNKDYKKHQDRIFFYLGPVEDLQVEYKFNFIISSIPFLNLDVDTVIKILKHYVNLADKNCQLGFYEHMFFRAIKRKLPIDAKSNFFKLDELFNKIVKDSSSNTINVWRNFLPIDVHYIPIENLKKIIS